MEKEKYLLAEKVLIMVIQLKSLYTHFLVSIPFPNVMPFHCSSGLTPVVVVGW